ncbi:MAG: hypothetical protein EPO24_04115 [Bacteroidetes bacterium]|nr:MAG: hypothetical protein EPO24_04115 [Bacteroidota bacterium]
MTQQKYNLPGNDGKPVTKTLALPGTKRIKNFLKCFGFDSLEAMMSKKGLEDYSKKRFDVALDAKKLRDILDICLVENASGVQLDDIEDLRPYDDVIQDFFEQRAQNIRERLNSLPNSENLQLTQTKQ